MRDESPVLSVKLININVLPNSIQMKLLQWRNQEFVRKNMFNSNKIEEEEHKAFLKKLPSYKEEKQLFVLFIEDVAKGVIQYYKYDEEYELGYYLINEYDKGKKIGKLMEYIVIEYIFNNLEVSRIVTRTLKTNLTGSLFQSSMGFKTEENTDQQINYQVLTYEYWKKNKNVLKEKINVEQYALIKLYDYANREYVINE